MPSLDQIRALLKAEQDKQEARSSGKPSGNSQPDAFLAFWNIPENDPLNLRFLDDADQNNPYFWREREMITLTFKGIVGVHSDPVKVTVPCNEMWVEKSCPVLKQLREWYKVANDTNDDELKKLAGSYWKKKTYLFQCFVAPDSAVVKDDNAPENPIRRVLVNKNVFDKVKSILLNRSVTELPTHPQRGRDFSVVKTKNGGGFNTYDMSQWAMTERPLTTEEQAAIDTYGLWNLEDFMPKKPTPEELKAIEEMFEASVDGKAYDPSRWAFAYRPAGVQKPVEGSAPSTPAPAQQNEAVAPAAPVAPVVPAQPVVPVQPQAPVQEAQAAQPKAQNTTTSALLAKIKAKG